MGRNTATSQIYSPEGTESGVTHKRLRTVFKHITSRSAVCAHLWLADLNSFIDEACPPGSSSWWHNAKQNSVYSSGQAKASNNVHVSVQLSSSIMGWSIKILQNWKGKKRKSSKSHFTAAINDFHLHIKPICHRKSIAEDTHLHEHTLRHHSVTVWSRTHQGWIVYRLKTTCVYLRRAWFNSWKEALWLCAFCLYTSIHDWKLCLQVLPQPSVPVDVSPGSHFTCSAFCAAAVSSTVQLLYSHEELIYWPNFSLLITSGI